VTPGAVRSPSCWDTFDRERALALLKDLVEAQDETEALRQRLSELAGGAEWLGLRRAVLSR